MCCLLLQGNLLLPQGNIAPTTSTVPLKGGDFLPLPPNQENLKIITMVSI